MTPSRWRGTAQSAETWWVVRPDGHLAARGSKGEDFAAALMTAAGVVTSDRILVKGTHA